MSYEGSMLVGQSFRKWPEDTKQHVSTTRNQLLSRLIFFFPSFSWAELTRNLATLALVLSRGLFGSFRGRVVFVAHCLLVVLDTCSFVNDSGRTDSRTLLLRCTGTQRR